MFNDEAMNVLRLFTFAIFIFIFSFSCNHKKVEERKEKVVASNLIPYSLKATIPHDENAFTQGLTIHQDTLYESTGRDNSYLAAIDLQTGSQLKKVELDNQYFGEGITILNNKLYQLTWTSHTGFIYDRKTLNKVGTFNYDTEGWGLTNDGTHLIMSDGSATLHYLDTSNFEIVRRIQVKENTFPVSKLNELEYHNGFIYANQWETNFIYKIDPETGKVVGKIDFTPLVNEVKRKNPKADVLNGIAYNEKTGDFLITGKLWPRAYWVKINEQMSSKQ